jgi:60 kDa SS-A/Ro ribonucleoprotein
MVNAQLFQTPKGALITAVRRGAGLGGGGSAPLALLNKERAKVELVILVSENESWVDATRRGTTQAAERNDIMDVGGFSDAVFAVMASFAEGKTGPEHWVGEIEKVSLTAQ